MTNIQNIDKHDIELIYRLKAFSDIVIRLASEHDIDNLLKLILSELRRFSKADAGSLYIKEKNLLIFKVTQNDTLEAKPILEEEFKTKIKSFSLPINEKSLAGLTAYRKKTFNIPDVPASPYHDPAMDRKFGYALTSMLVVPMINHAGDIVGVLQLMNAKGENGYVPFDESIIPQVEALANQAAVLLDNLRLYDELDKLFVSLVKYSAKAIDARDPCTKGHSDRVAKYAMAVAKKMNLFDSDTLKELEYAAFFHDIGKIGVKEDVLTKENKLSAQQLETIKERFNTIKQYYITESLKLNWSNEKLNNILQEVDNDLQLIEKYNEPSFLSAQDLENLKKIYSKTFYSYDNKPRKYLLEPEYDNLSIIKGNLNTFERKNIESHALQSYEILSQILFPPNLSKIPEIAMKHHEKLDGSGYPYGCKEDEISLQVRILAVVDIFDALVAQDRPYKKPMTNEKAFAILDSEAQAKKLDPEVIEVLKQVINNKEAIKEKG